MVNTGYICTIKENQGNNVSFEKVPIQASPELISILEGLVANTSATVLDMQSHMACSFPKSSRNWIDFISPYSYSDSYVCGTSYPSEMTLEEYNQRLAEKRRELEEGYEKTYSFLKQSDPTRYHNNKTQYVKANLDGYVRNLKSSYLSSAKRFITAHAYKQTLADLKAQGSIRMYSTDTVGWSRFEYPVTNDVTITILTNFGYGSSSYFILCMKYKGIDILPYSYLVKYYNANMRDLISYTRLYSVRRDSWEVAFDYVEKASNTASKDEALFVRSYIMDEVNQMLHGLETILSNAVSYVDSLVAKAGEECKSDYLTVRNMDLSEKKTYEVYPEEMTMVIKSEKVTDALDFLDNLSKLSISVPEIESAENRIKEMAQSLNPELSSSIRRIEEQICNLDVRIDEHKRSIEEKEATLAPYEKEIDDLYEKEGASSDGIVYRSTIQENYATEHPAYKELRDKLSELRRQMYNIMSERSTRDSFRASLARCKRKISLIEESVAA